MKIAIANDHRGYILKRQLAVFLEEHGYQVLDLGTHTEDAVDYPIYAKEASKKVLNKEADFAILICGTGIGMSIAANKIRGIRCAKVDTVEEAYLTRVDNDANVLALSYKLTKQNACDITEKFLTTETSLEERHVRRRKMLEDIENEC